MDDYTKKIEFKFEVDDSEINKLDEEIDQMSDSPLTIDVGIKGKDQIDDLISRINRLNQVSQGKIRVEDLPETPVSDKTSDVKAPTFSSEAFDQVQEQMAKLNSLNREISSVSRTINNTSKLNTEDAQHVVKELEEYLQKLVNARNELTKQVDNPYADLLQDNVLANEVQSQLQKVQEYDEKIEEIQQRIEELSRLNTQEAQEATQALQDQLNQLLQARDSLQAPSGLKSFIGDSQLVDTLQAQLDSIKEYDSQIEEIQEKIQEVSKLNTTESKEVVKQLESQLKTLKKERSKVTQEDDKDNPIVDSLENIFNQKTGGLGTAMTSAKTGGWMAIAAWGIEQISNLIDKFTDWLGTQISDAVTELKDVYSSSKLTNDTTWTNMIEYGMSSSESYAYTNAMEYMDFDSFEQLYRMDSSQRAKFFEKMEQYQERYTQLEESGYFESMEDLQWELADLQEEFKYNIMEWLVDHKDTIVDFMELLMDAAEVVLNVLGWLMDNFGGQSERSDSTRAQATQDIINSNSYSTSNTTNNSVSIDNTFNGVASTDRSWLANAGAMTYEQIIAALK